MNYSRKVKVSVVILTKNEEERIKDCINSISDWADEIVVVDDESSDKTREICRAYGAKVIVHKSDLKFDLQRNFGISKTENDWILSMDSDEIVPEDAIKEIKKAIDEPGEYIAFKMKRKDHFAGRCLINCGMYSDKIKLFNKNFVKYKELGKRHEELEINGKIGTINAVIEHYPYEGIIDFIQKQIYYAETEAKVLLKEKGILPWKSIRYNLIIKPIKLFWKLHIKQKGYKDGEYGLIWNLLQVVRRIILWMKYWELTKDKDESMY